MLMVGTANTAFAIMEGMAVLRRGGSVEEAVEAVLRPVEDNVQDDSVGLGGLPNLLGEVELDAAIMEGTRLRAGAVGPARFRHPISIARRVMEELPTSSWWAMARLGSPRRSAPRKHLSLAACQRLERVRARPDPGGGDPDGEPLTAPCSAPGGRPGGTANVIALDDAGRICRRDHQAGPSSTPGA